MNQPDQPLENSSQEPASGLSSDDEQLNTRAEAGSLITSIEEAPNVAKPAVHMRVPEGIRTPIPRRPRPVSSALSSTMRMVRGWTDQVLAVRNVHQQPALTEQRNTEQTPTQAISKIGPESTKEKTTLALPQASSPAGQGSSEQMPTQALPRTLPVPLASYQVPSQENTRTLRHQHRQTSPWKRSRATRVAWLMRQRRERSSMRRRKGKRVGTILGSVLAALLVILISSGIGYSYAYYQNQQPRLQSLANEQIDQSTRIYDRNGTLLYTLYSENGRGTPVSYKYLPGVLQDAMIAAEDPTFWTNIGIDPQGILCALSQYFSDGGQVQSGGSTITQQLIKNLSNDRDLTIQRKLSEASLAIGLTRQYPKWKILEMYFNSSPFGAQEQGVEAAAEDFFGLTPKCDANFNCIPAVAFLDRDLTKCTVTRPKIDESTCQEDPLLGLARASFLAGMPQNPVIFDPIVDPANIPYALTRQDYVLQQMLIDNMSINLGIGDQTRNTGVITPAIIQQVEALTKNIKFVGFQDNKIAPHFVNWVIQTLANALGDNQDLVNGISVPGIHILNTAGLNIRTTLDLNLEKYVEQAINRHINQPEYQEYQGYTEILSRDDNLHDSAAVVMDAKTGEVLALDGSANWQDTSLTGSGQVNMALTPRQPGSAFKPIALAAAYQMGFYPGIVLPDYKTYFPTGGSQSQPVNNTNTYAPPDYGGSWHDIPANIETAISNSFNIPALKTEYYAGLQNVYKMAARLGITSINPKTGLVPSMVLGTEAVSLLQMVGSYQAFADQGLHIPPQNVLDIWDNYGRQLYHFDPNHPEATRVLSPQIAFLVTSTLDNEAARSIEFPGDTLLPLNDWTLPNGSHPQAAAKTGTTDSFKDNWTIGYTPDIVAGVWSGNANDSPMVNSIGITGAAPIWHSIIEYASGHCNEARDQIPCPAYDLGQTVGTTYTFVVPPGIVQQEVNTSNGLAGSGYSSYMINGEQPQQNGFGLLSRVS
jgi:membrane peptidoglycan carboxypeptidase